MQHKVHSDAREHTLACSTHAQMKKTNNVLSNLRVCLTMCRGIVSGFGGLSPLPVLLMNSSGAREGPRNHILIPKEDGTCVCNPRSGPDGDRVSPRALYLQSGHLVMPGYSKRCCAVDRTHGQEVEGPRRQVSRYHWRDLPRLGQPLSVPVRVCVK